MTVKEMAREVEHVKRKLRTRPVCENFGQDEIRRIGDKYFDLVYTDYKGYHGVMEHLRTFCEEYTGR